MGDEAGEGKKAPRIAAVDGNGAMTRASSVASVEYEQHRLAPLPAAADGGGGGGVAASAGGSVVGQSCSEEEEDKQVERFYALLANIRALRGLYSVGESGSVAADLGRKRPREAEAPWRPAFRMEDFEEEVSQVTGDAGCAVKKRGTSGAGVLRRPAAARARTAVDDHEEDEATEEARGRKLGRRVAAQG